MDEPRQAFPRGLHSLGPRGFFFLEHTMKSILSKLHAVYVDIAFAAKASDITPAQALFWTVAGAFIVCLPTAFFWALGTLWKATH